MTGREIAPLVTGCHPPRTPSRAAHSPTVGRSSRPLTGGVECGKRAAERPRKRYQLSPARNHQTGRRAGGPPQPGRGRNLRGPAPPAPELTARTGGGGPPAPAPHYKSAPSRAGTTPDHHRGTDQGGRGAADRPRGPAPPAPAARTDGGTGPQRPPPPAPPAARGRPTPTPRTGRGAPGGHGHQGDRPQTSPRGAGTTESQGRDHRPAPSRGTGPMAAPCGNCRRSGIRGGTTTPPLG